MARNIGGNPRPGEPVADASGWLRGAFPGSASPGQFKVVWGVIYFTRGWGRSMVYRMAFSSYKQSLSTALLPFEPGTKLQGKHERCRNSVGKGI